MAIEITEFSDVSISVSPTGAASGNFGILGFLTTESGIPTTERNRAYTKLTDVGSDWATSSEVYKAAQAFYGATPTPNDFVVLSMYDTDQAAMISGGGHLSLTDLVALSPVDFSVEVDNNTLSSTSISLSGATSLDDVASALETALGGNTAVIIEYVDNRFVIKSPTTGGASDIKFPVGTVAEALGLAQHQAAIADRVAAETPVDALAANLATGVDFTAFDVHKDLRDNITGGVGETTLNIGQWAEAAKKIFVNTTNNLATLSSSITTDVASLLKSNTLRYTLTTFSKTASQYPSSAVFGRAASVNFGAAASTITLNLKQIGGVTAEDLTPAEFATLKSKHCSAVIQIGKSQTGYADSRMASGSFFDSVHGLLWLENRCEVDMFNLLYQSTTKVPFTQVGINLCKARLERSLEAAVRNGLAAPGYLPDGTYLPNGYIVEAVELANVPSSDKSNGVYVGLSFKMVGAGALHEIVVSGEFAE
jgi:hypothetical protein